MFPCSLIYCVIGLSVSGLRKIRFNAYTPRRISTKNQFPNKPGFPLSALIILVWYPYVSLFPDLLCNIGLSVSGLRKIPRFNAYTLCRISTKNQFTKKPGFPLSMYIILAWGNNNGENGRNLRSWRVANSKHSLVDAERENLLRIPTNSSFYINCSS